jgi:hypothetical protein
MRDCGVRPVAGDRIEGKVLEGAGGTAEFFELVDNSDLRQIALRRIDIEPVQKARHGEAIATMGCARTFALNGILACLGQNGRIRRVDDFASGGLQGEAHAFGN